MADFFERNTKMDRIFKIETAVRTALVVALLATVFITGCPKKQTEPPKAPAAPAAVEQKKSAPQTSARAVDVKAQDPNTLAAPAPDMGKPVETKTPGRKPDNSTNKLPPPSAQKQSMPEPADLKPFESLKESEEKIDFMNEYADEHPELMTAVVYKALDDNDVDVRSAAMEMLVAREPNDPNVVYVAYKAIKDTEPQIRHDAVEALTAVTDPAVQNILIEAITDSSEEVRAAAIELADQKEPAIRLPVLKAGITSQYEDVRDAAVSSLIDVSSPAAVDILIEGMKNPNPEAREPFKDALSFLISQEFNTYDQAYKWWNANRNKFDDELTEKD